MIARTDTKTLILDTAEQLFAERGFAGTSLRAITRAAGVNLAAVHYHYGSKDELLKAVLNRMIVPMNEERLQLLDAAIADAAPEPPSLEAILEAFLAPDLHLYEALRDRQSGLPRLVSRSYIEGTPMMRSLMTEQFAEVRVRFFEVLQTALPHLSMEEIGWRMHNVVGIVIYLFAEAGSPDQPALVDDVEGTLKKLVAFVSPGLEAPAVIDADTNSHPTKEAVGTS